MVLPGYLTTVTPVSKFLALGMLVLFPLAGFYLETRYQQKISPAPAAQLKMVKVPAGETEEDLIRRCGAFSIDTIRQEHFDVVKGPMWSPDCRHIAWSNWQSGTGYPADGAPILQRSVSPREGLYLYNDKNSSVKKIYTPRQLDEITELIGWDDSNTIQFSTSSGKFQFDLTTNHISPL